MPFVSRQPRLAWLLTFALAIAGWTSAHEVAYRLALPHPHVGGPGSGKTGHAYLAYASLLVVLCLLVAVLCTAGLVARNHPLGTPSRRLLLLFVLLPPLGFALQEVTESLLTTGVLQAEAALEPTFLVGILLQLPFALAALFAAHVLFAVARSLARTVKGARRPTLVSLDLSLPPAVDPCPPRLPALAFGYGERGPPRGATA
jgi:hypothetical protein